LARFSYINIGKFPASNVRINPQVFFMTKEHDRIEEELRTRCEGDLFVPVSHKLKDGSQGVTLFPNEKVNWEQFEATNSLVINPADVLQYAWIEGSTKVVDPWIYGCATYEFGAPGNARQTAFIYRVGHREEAATGEKIVRRFVPVDRPLNKEDVVLFPVPTRGLTN
jgi:hypothetical protein